ncbi:single-stranded DNA-binding protein [Clostridium cellulovorans]|uniref:Single-stranded DNA-binding protein n=1 Tax=Clostridium cellulovorans (strain ATCC 35296 / DSM 3052 / OCM 3 / 743B) TaxID=573061 RepID=D9SSV4_CLOC7|nr:single-stranded DNA-binding protein [Clostridium cellulovorans]ADL52616.1 single-strand binding protein [Clostridium cellulovorans 743B]
MNKVMLVGRLVKEPELKAFEDNFLCKFTLAVNTGHINSKGEKEVDFIPVALWGKRAETFNKYMKKGNMVSISGKLKIRNFEVDGNRKYVTEVVAENFQFLEWNNKNEMV